MLDIIKRSATPEKADMSFMDHLEELRWHILRAAIAILLGAVLIFIQIHTVVNNVILGPAHKDFITYTVLCKIGHYLHLSSALCLDNFNIRFQSTAMTEQFMSTFTIAFVGGFIVAAPYVFWEIWRFLRPALTPQEIKKTRGIIGWTSLLFFMGVAFGYFVLTPFMVNFYANYSLSDLIEIRPTLSDYVENLIYTTVGIGILFQLPLLIMFLSRVGIISPATLKKYRRYAIVFIIIGAAIITPSTDPFSLILVALPLYALYESGVYISSKAYPSKPLQEEEWS